MKYVWLHINKAWRLEDAWSHFKAGLVSLITIARTLKNILVIRGQVCKIFRFYYMFHSEKPVLGKSTSHSHPTLVLFSLAFRQSTIPYAWIHSESGCAVDCTKAFFFFFFNLFRGVLDVFVFHVNAPWQMLTVFVTQCRVPVVTLHASMLYLCIRLVFG